MADNTPRHEIDENRKLRTAFMRWLFEETDGSQTAIADPAEFLADQLRDEGFAKKLRNAIEYLEGKRLLRAHWTMAGLPSVQITHTGVVAMEKALGNPDQATNHFVPINVVNVLGSVVNSQIQQASPGATQQRSNISDELSNALAFLKAAREAIDVTQFDQDFRAKAQSDLDLIETEIAAEEPNWKRARAFGQSLRGIIEAGLGGTLTHALLNTPWPAA